MGSIIDKYGTSNPNYKSASTPTGAAPAREMTIVEKYGTSNPNYVAPKPAAGYSDPLVEAARGGNTPNLNINAFGANPNAGKRAGDVLGAAVTGGIGNFAEALGQITQPTGLTIGENARLAAEGKTTQAEVMKAETEKADRIRENIKEPLYDFSDRMQAQSQQYTEAAKEGLGKGGQFAVDLGVTGTQLVGDIALGALNPALGTAALATRAFGDSAQEARQAGATETQQQLYGTASAATSILVEKIAQVGGLFKRAYGGSIAGGSVDDILTKVIGKVTKNPTLQRILGSAIGEGGEEALEALIQPALQAIYDKGERLNKTWFTDNSEEAKEYLAEVGYNALIGGTLGLIGAGGNANVATQGAETTQNAQNGAPNAPASRVWVEGDNNTPAPQNGTGASAGANEVVTANRVNSIAKDPAALAELGIDPNGKTAGESANPAMDVFAEDVRNRAQNPSVGAADAGFDPFTAAENEYGVIDGKARSVRMDDVPRSVDGVKKTSETASTLKGAAITTDNFVSKLEDAVVDGKFARVPVTDNERVTAVEERIKEEGWDRVLSDWTSDARSGRANDDIVTTGVILYNNALNAGNEAVALDIALDLAEVATVSGRALQAFKLIQKMTPSGQLYSVQRSVKSLQKELVDKYGEKAPKLVIEDGVAQAVLDAKTQDERNAAMQEIYKSIGKQMPSTFADKWNAWRYLAMLGNVRTHVRNVIGNATFAPAVLAKDTIAAGIEAVVSKASGVKIDRTKSAVGVSKADRSLLKATFAYSANMKDALQGAGKYSDLANANKYIEEGRQIFKTKWLEKARRGNAALMDAEDMMFSRPHFAYAMAQYCKANGITEAEIVSGSKKVDKAVEYAVQEALKATYRDTTALSDILSRKLNEDGKNGKVAKAVNAAKSGILPFTKTPANLLSRAFDYSPAGIIKGVAQAVNAVTKGEATAAQAIDSLASGLTGTGVMALGAYLAAQGLVRGAEDDDEKQAAFDELVGHQPYSMELPNGKSVTLDWLAPMSLPFFVGVNYYEAMQREAGDSSMDALMSSIYGVADPLLELSCLQSLNDLIDAVGYSDEAGLMSVAADVALSYVMQALPTVFGQGERITENVRMTTYTDKNEWLSSDAQYALGKASQRFPIWDYGQIPYIDAWGRTEDSGNLAQRVWENALSPAYHSKVEVDPLEQEVQRIYDATGENVLPERPEKYFTVDGERIDLTAEQYTEYAATRGNKLYDLMQKVIESSAYKSASDSGKAEMLVDAKDYATKTAKAAVSNYELDGWVAKAKNTGIAPEKYIAVLAQLDKVNDGSQSITQAEAQKALDATGLSRSEKAKMWNNINKQWKSNPYK